MRLALVDEGKVLVYIPDPREALAPHGLEPAWLPVFYNPKMEFNRDLAVLALQVYLDRLSPRKPIFVVEPLAATGVRALRYALEVDGVLGVYASDISRVAYELIESNVALNNAWDRVRIFNVDANTLLYNLKTANTPVLAVDIDPYGSPAPFMEAALNTLGDGGLLMVTATDTAVLEGSKRSKAFRRYGVQLTKTPCSREIAVRTLLGYIARVAAAHDRWVKPLISIYIDYYVRIVAQVRRSAGEAERMLWDKIGYASYYPELKYTTIRQGTVESIRGAQEVKIGPLWIGETLDREFIELSLGELEGKFGYLRTKPKLGKLLLSLREESLVQGELYQRLDLIASALRKQTPPRHRMVEELRARGFKATTTHYHPVAIRTDASPRELFELI
jgi:tRNA (guanine26-N2/guanine27-N2)-dimethyltransferase